MGIKKYLKGLLIFIFLTFFAVFLGNLSYTLASQEAVQAAESLTQTQAQTQMQTQTQNLMQINTETQTSSNQPGSTQNIQKVITEIKKLENKGTSSSKLSQENQNKNRNFSANNQIQIESNSKQSSIERSFSLRTKEYNIVLKQFGYAFFKHAKPIPASVSVDSSYVLGPGDVLLIYVIGQIPGNINLNFPQQLIVDREGKIYIPQLGIFYVWGKTLGQVEEEISQKLGINIKLTVAKVRTFPVYVSGEVNNPGVVMVTNLHTVIDALIMAGGGKKTGSLRHIIITRKIGNKIKKYQIDLYDLLLKGKPVDLRLKDGDVIFVPPVKNVAGIAGGVHRPAIYEFLKGDTIKTLINMAGGILPSGYKYKVILQRYVNNQYLKVFEGSLSNATFLNQKLQPGDLVIIKKVIPIPENAIEVKGYTPYPGIYQYKKNLTLKKFLTKDFFYVDTDTKFALIIRHYPLGTPPQYITFSPEDILCNKIDIPLKPGDQIIFYRFGQTENLDLNKVKNVVIVSGVIKYPGFYAFKPGMKLSNILSKNMLKLNTNLYYAEIKRYDPNTLKIVKIIKFTPIFILEGKKDIPLQPMDIIQFYPKYVFQPVEVSGCIKNPRLIPFHPGLTLKEALVNVNFCKDIKKLKAEIFTKASFFKEVYLYNLLIENNPSANVKLSPGDRIIIKPLNSTEPVEKVVVAGYVKKPGVYPITEHTTLYDILKSAGGFRKDAYPEGIVILRKSIAEMQKKLLSQAIVKMEQSLEKEEAGILQAELTQQELKARQAAFESKRKLLELMQKTEVTGRLTGLKIPRDLSKLKNSPYNIFLENGDKIIVPKKPSEVLVFGEVNNPSAIIFRPGYTLQDYINLAGGFTKNADIKDIFIIKPNGSAISLAQNTSFISWDSKKHMFVINGGILTYKPKPGDAIIVPTHIKVPIMWRPLIKDVIQIIYQSALTVYTVSHL